MVNPVWNDAGYPLLASTTPTAACSELNSTSDCVKFPFTHFMKILNKSLFNSGNITCNNSHSNSLTASTNATTEQRSFVCFVHLFVWSQPLLSGEEKTWAQFLARSLQVISGNCMNSRLTKFIKCFSKSNLRGQYFQAFECTTLRGVFCHQVV